MRSAKIVGIHGGGATMKNAGADNTSVRPLPVPLVKLRELMKLKTTNLLRKLFESADDSLFEMADKAGTNGDQAMYFDAMRELRMQRKQIATEVIKGVIQSFNELGHYDVDRGEESQTGQNDDLDALSLVQNDELELKVAIDGMVNRVRNAAGSALNDLHARTEFLITPNSLRVEQTPAGPEILCDCFAVGCTMLDVEIKARLVVFKLFEKYVLSDMAGVYADANQLLIQHGVMPDLKKNRASSRQQHMNAHSEPTHAAAGPRPFDGIPVLQPIDPRTCEAQFEDLRDLMHSDLPPSQTDASEQATLDGCYYSQGDIVSALSLYQKQHLKHLDEQLACNVIDFRKLLNKQLARANTPADYSDLDSDVINLVAMLFEFILDDRQLQPTMKALISRLQIPILKVAIMDRTFFNRGGHPARKLLNEIAFAAIGWNEKKDGKRDRLKEKIESIVQTVLTEFDQDLELFASLLEDFSSFMDLEQRRGLLVEQRTKDSERGKAANELAKQAVQTLFEKSMQDKQVPDCVVELLQEGWSRLMVLQYLKDGESSSGWKQSSELVDDLIWTVCPPQEGAGTGTKLLRMIPGVIKRLREGLKEAAFDEFRAGALLQALEDTQVSAIQNIQQHSEPDSVLNASGDASTSTPSNPETTAPETDFSSEQASDFAQRQEEVVADLIRETQEIEAEFSQHQAVSVTDEASLAPDSASVKVQSSDSEVDANTDLQQEHEEIVLAAIDKPVGEALIDESDPFVRQVDKLTMGCWFEFQNEDRPERCKLAAVIKATGKYIFVNRSGVKVAEKTRMGLAVELRRGSVQILNDGLLFDRALESVIGNLRGRNKQS